jgi:hypothetical protein
MAYQSWNTRCKVCGCNLRPGEGEFVAYPVKQALCKVHFELWKQDIKAGKEYNKQKKLQKPTLFD